MEWYTPSWIFEDLDLTFDLDPASPHDFTTAVPAITKYTIFDNGLKKPWHGRVWLNPPYGPDTGMWMERMISHGNGIALIFSRTDAKWCQAAMKSANAILFLAGRVAFVPGNENLHKKGRTGAGIILFAFGSECAIALAKMQDKGFFIQPAVHQTEQEPWQIHHEENRNWARV